MLQLKVPFPGIGNDVNVAVPVVISSGLNAPIAPGSGDASRPTVPLGLPPYVSCCSASQLCLQLCCFQSILGRERSPVVGRYQSLSPWFVAVRMFRNTELPRSPFAHSNSLLRSANATISLPHLLPYVSCLYEPTVRWRHLSRSILERRRLRRYERVRSEFA